MKAGLFQRTAKVTLTAFLAGSLTTLSMPMAQAQTPTCFRWPATIVGTPGDDTLTGTSGSDVIVGLGGDDTIKGLGGGDLICGDDGNDVLQGGRGIDWIDGGNGDDFLGGGHDRDILHGGAGADKIAGRKGYDLAYGGSGDDVIRLGAGPDQAFGDEGHDTIYGGPGRDALMGATEHLLQDGLLEDGNDKLFGGKGYDYLSGMNGADRLRGGPGDDILIGGYGLDTIDGRDGDDRCDKNGSESPTGCENIATLTYRQIEVHGIGGGVDPTGSGFGDPFFHGAQAVVHVDLFGFTPSLGGSFIDGADFTLSLPDTQGEIFLDKFSDSEFFFIGHAYFDENTKSPLVIQLIAIE